MGSTGHGLYKTSKTGNVNTETFGIPGAINYKGKVPAGKGLDPVGSNKITLKVPTLDKSNVLFQFKLAKDEKTMTITGFKDGVPEIKCKVAVDSGSPSLDKVMATGSKSEKLNAVKLKDLFNQSTEIKENQLGAIANKLIANHKKRKGDD